MKEQISNPGPPTNQDILWFLDRLEVGSNIILRDREEKVLGNYDVKEIGTPEETDGLARRRLTLRGRRPQAERAEEFSVFCCRDQAGNSWVEDDKGQQLNIFEAPDVEVLSPYRTEGRKPKSVRTPQEMQELLSAREKEKVTIPFMDEHGQELGTMDYCPDAGDYYVIYPQYHENIAGAEAKDEHIYLTDPNGQILPERATRAVAREQNRRYLIVTNLLFHDKEALLQERSKEKAIDPGKLSASAHGVAKEIYWQTSVRVDDTTLASYINAALEINEELRYNPDAQPFKTIIWPGTIEELKGYADEYRIDDPNTVYLIPELVVLDSATYPLEATDNASPRTRAILPGFVLSRERPLIAADPAEVQGVLWERLSKMVEDPRVTDDLQSCANIVFDRWLSLHRDPAISNRLAREALRQFLGDK